MPNVSHLDLLSHRCHHRKMAEDPHNVTNTAQASGKRVLSTGSLPASAHRSPSCLFPLPPPFPARICILFYLATFRKLQTCHGEETRGRQREEKKSLKTSSSRSDIVKYPSFLCYRNILFYVHWCLVHIHICVRMLALLEVLVTDSCELP